ncbi:MAG: tetratricopeptide repeat protein [Polyangiaceae bacterium]|nr:tetratricopeptide repeat protein [Polyangiaceae bacterium]
MAEQKKKSSRRAQRRAREEQELKSSKAKKRAEVEAEEEDTEDADSEDEADDESEDDAESDEEEETSDDGEEDSEEEEEDIRKIRDRNKRLRAKAAAKRRQRRRQEAAQAVGLDAGEMVDDVLARSSAKAGRFIKNNFKVLQWVIIVGLVGTVGWYVYSYVHKQEEAKATDALMKGIRAENGSTEDQQQLPEEMGVQTFKDHQARLKAAEEAYREALKDAAEPAGQALAHLGLAGVLFDQAKYEDAKAEYESVLGSALSGVDLDVQARATEGAALSVEAKGDKKAALELYKKLEGIEGYKPLGQYHQARLALEAGDKEGAKKLLLEVNEKLRDDKFARQGYVYGMSLQMLAALDPQAAEEAQKKIVESPEEQLKKLQEMEERLKNLQGPAGDILKKLGIGPDGKPLKPAPSGTPAPAPAPSGGE